MVIISQTFIVPQCGLIFKYNCLFYFDFDISSNAIENSFISNWK